MNRKPCLPWLFVLAVAGLSGCGGDKKAATGKTAAPAPHQITGKLEANSATTGADSALNAGGDSLFIRNGVKRYRLFVKTPVEATPGLVYTVEGVEAQKAIEEIGDPDKGKKGYPLASSCQRVIRMAWGSQSMDLADGQASVLRAQVNRYPARTIFLVTKLTPAPDEGKKAAEEEKEFPSISVPAEKQAGVKIAGPTSQPAPFWAPEGGLAKCKVIIDEKGVISELETGAQLCEAVPWGEFKYPPPVQGGKPVRVKTEVSVQFDARK
jgi:hypothetical protein